MKTKDKGEKTIQGCANSIRSQDPWRQKMAVSKGSGKEFLKGYGHGNPTHEAPRI
jgi:hypothetical protein